MYDKGRRKWFISQIKGNKDSEDAFRARARDAFKRIDWNTYRIECRGKSLRIFVNGVPTTDVEDTVDASGVLAIQHHVEKRRIRHPGSRAEGVECETWDVTASHVYGQDLIGIEAG